MSFPLIRVLAVMIVCLTASVGCDRTSEVELSKALETTREEAARVTADAALARVELDNAIKERKVAELKLAEAEAIAAKATAEAEEAKSMAAQAELRARVGGGGGKDEQVQP